MSAQKWKRFRFLLLSLWFIHLCPDLICFSHHIITYYLSLVSAVILLFLILTYYNIKCWNSTSKNISMLNICGFLLSEDAVKEVCSLSEDKPWTAYPHICDCLEIINNLMNMTCSQTAAQEIISFIMVSLLILFVLFIYFLFVYVDRKYPQFSTCNLNKKENRVLSVLYPPSSQQYLENCDTLKSV